jgi:hypothetical protein
LSNSFSSSFFRCDRVGLTTEAGDVSVSDPLFSATIIPSWAYCRNIYINLLPLPASLQRYSSFSWRKRSSTSPNLCSQPSFTAFIRGAVPRPLDMSVVTQHAMTATRSRATTTDHLDQTISRLLHATSSPWPTHLTDPAVAATRSTLARGKSDV